MILKICASSRKNMSAPERTRPMPRTIAARRAWIHLMSSLPTSRGGSRTFSVSAAAMPSGYGKFSSTTKCLRSGTASSVPRSAATESQMKVCIGVGVEVELHDLGLAQHVEGGEHDAHEGGLRGRGARRLDDVVLPAVVALAGDDAQNHEAEEGRDDRDVRAEAELQHHVGIRDAHDAGDDHAGQDGLDRDFRAARPWGRLRPRC